MYNIRIQDKHKNGSKITRFFKTYSKASCNYETYNDEELRQILNMGYKFYQTIEGVPSLVCLPATYIVQIALCK